MSLSTRGTRTHSDTRDTSHAVHLKPPFLKRHCDVGLAPPPPAFLRPASCTTSSLTVCRTSHSSRPLLCRLVVLHVTSCGSARCLRFRLSSCPRCVRRSSTTHGCSASTQWSLCTTLRSMWGARSRLVVRLRAPLRRLIRLFLHRIRVHCRLVHLVLGLPGRRTFL